MRATERISSVHRDTIVRLMVRIGDGCQRLMDREMRGLTCQRIQIDEIWSFVGKKQRRLNTGDNPTKTGDMWTFVAIDADSKLIPCYRVGKRTGREAQAFIADLESRLSNRVQLSSDVAAVHLSIDFGQTWMPTKLARAQNRYGPQRFATAIGFPKKGYYEIWARATDDEGRAQPMVVPGWNAGGYGSNACHRIAVRIV